MHRTLKINAEAKNKTKTMSIRNQEKCWTVRKRQCEGFMEKIWLEDERDTKDITGKPSWVWKINRL